MKVGERLEFRRLRCVAKYHRDLKLRDGTEYSQWTYQFYGPDGRTYEYRGRHYMIEKGESWDIKATVARIWRDEITLKRPVRLEPIATTAFL